MDKFAMKMYLLLQAGLLGLRETVASRERGATAVEYGLMVALIAGVITLAVAALGVKVSGLFATVSAAIP